MDIVRIHLTKHAASKILVPISQKHAFRDNALPAAAPVQTKPAISTEIVFRLLTPISKTSPSETSANLIQTGVFVTATFSFRAHRRLAKILPKSMHATAAQASAQIH